MRDESRSGRAAIARASENEPAIDEATRNPDTKTGSKVLEMPEGLQDEDRKIVMVAYSEENAKRSGRTIEIRDGEVV